MKCKKCGAEIRKDCVYCSICGTEVQLVPEYNLLDEDILSGILKEEAKEGILSPPREEKHKKINTAIWGGICIVILAAVLMLCFVFLEIQNRYRNTYSYQYRKAEEYLKEQDYESALPCLQKAIELKPGDKEAEKRLLDVYLATERSREAAAILEGLIAEDKQDRDSVQKLIGLYDKNEEYDEIIRLCGTFKGSSMMDLFEEYMVEPPTFSQTSGTYAHPIAIMISSAQDHDIFYTADGKDPIQHGILYEGEILLKKEGRTVIAAAARNKKGIFSDPIKAEYIITSEPPAMPSVSLPAGTYGEPQMITVSLLQDCTAYYTWDGSDPSKESFRYTGPLEMPQGNHVLSVVQINSAGQKSSVYRAHYSYMP